MARGEKILWHSPLRWLTCFAPEHDACADPGLHDWVYPGMHELIYPLREGPPRIVGIKLCELQGLLTETNLLGHCTEDGSLAPLAVFDHGIAWMEAHSERYRTMDAARRTQVLEKNARARAFLEAYPLTIPAGLWQRALPQKSS